MDGSMCRWDDAAASAKNHTQVVRHCDPARRDLAWRDPRCASVVWLKSMDTRNSPMTAVAAAGRSKAVIFRLLHGHNENDRSDH